MKKLLLFCIIPFFIISQEMKNEFPLNIAIAPQVSYQYLNNDFPVEQPSLLYGINLASQINKDVLISIGFHVGKINNNQDEYFPAYPGTMSGIDTNGDGIDDSWVSNNDSHSDYTLSNSTQSENRLINCTISYFLNSKFSINSGFYGRKYYPASYLSESWEESVFYGVNGFFSANGVVQQRGYMEGGWETGINLGCSLRLKNLFLNVGCMLPLISQDQMWEQVNGGTNEASLIESKNSNINFLFSISYLFNIIQS